MIITAGEIAAIMPQAKSRIPIYLEPLNDALSEFDIGNPDRLAAFFAQIAVESAELSRVEENLNYTSAERLTLVWPTRFPNVAVALPYTHNPQKLANHVYANRLGNGNEASGDGWRHRGAGLIQLTGKESQTACGSFFGFKADAVSAWLLTPEGASRSACFYWRTRGLNPLADVGQFAMITRRVNPAMMGAKERVAYWERAKAVLA